MSRSTPLPPSGSEEPQERTDPNLQAPAAAQPPAARPRSGVIPLTDPVASPPTSTKRTRSGDGGVGDSEAFGKYRLAGAISTGGMAELFVALQAGLEGFTKVVAVKRILPQMAASPEFIEMFLDEARLAARLDHPNIVRIYDLGSIDQRYFISMEFLPGEDLARVIRVSTKARRQIGTDLAATMVQAAADGLHYAHELTDEHGQPVGLVHRDVNPSNIILTYHGQIKLVDFGIAKASINTGGTQQGMLKGKPGYIAPEQVQGAPADRRSDVFCLGIVLWELLAGRKLFLRETDAATLMAIIQGEIPSIRQMRRDVDDQLEAVVSRALARDPEKRFQTTREMYEALEHWFAGRTSRPSQRHLAAWLTELFGEARANAKLAIAKGSNLRTNISQVMKAVSQQTGVSPLPSVPPPRSGSGSAKIPASYSVREGSFPGVPRPALPRSRRVALLAGFLSFVAAAVGVGVVVTRPPRPAMGPPAGDAPAAPVSLTLESEPPGAFVFVGGEPTGRTTPIVLSHLRAGQQLLLRLEKEGFAPARESLTLPASGSIARRLTLQPLVGRVVFKNVPKDVQLMVDGKPSAEEVELSVGSHSVQLVSGNKVRLSRGITVTPGEQTVAFPER